LGLAITKHLVELMGGTLHLQSMPNVGTQVGFWVHVHLPDEATANKLATEEFGSLTVEDVSFALSSETMLNLPEDWREEFGQAVIEVDLERALAVLENIAHYNESLAFALTKLVRAYRFDLLQGLMKEANRKV
jgi:hypothetical protein